VKDRIGNKLWFSNGISKGASFFGTNNDRYIRVLTETRINGFMSEGLFNLGSDTESGGKFYSEYGWGENLDFVI